jgi:hypothetical protein
VWVSVSWSVSQGRFSSRPGSCLSTRRQQTSTLGLSLWFTRRWTRRSRIVQSLLWRTGWILWSTLTVSWCLRAEHSNSTIIPKNCSRTPIPSLRSCTTSLWRRTRCDPIWWSYMKIGYIFCIGWVGW